MQTDKQTPDCVTQAVIAGQKAGFSGEQADDATHKMARRIAKDGPQSDAPADALESLLDMIREHPGDVELQLAAGDFIERSHDYTQARSVWSGIKKRHPIANRAFIFMLRWAVRDGGDAAARLLFDAEYPEVPTAFNDQVGYARCLIELKEKDRAADIYRGLLEERPGHPSVSHALADLLVSQGEFHKALSVVKAVPAKDRKKGRLADLEARLRSCVETIVLLPPSIAGRHKSIHAAAMAGLIEANRPARLARARGADFLGRMAMVSGSLGMGGAERQFTVTAEGLKSAIDQAALIGGTQIVGPLDIYARSLRSRAKADFFLPRMEAAGLTVRQMAHKTATANRYAGFFPDPAGRFAALLPRDVSYGLERVADQWLVDRLDLVSIWQDGMVLNTALAAIAAQVPRIALHMRGMPPSLRPDREKPEYLPLYRLLAREPGIAMITNSAFGARAYEEWLELDRNHIHVIYNGVEQPLETPDEGHEELWRRFADATKDTPLTLGTVFRFDANKRPVDMVKLFGALAGADMPVRLVMIGDGPLLPAAQDMARDLGLADRVLFVPQATGLGFWLKQFDLACLVSRSEGVPNSLIEAQMCGVPVVTTEAGGALEAIKQSETGLSLGNADKPDWRAMRDTIMGLLANQEQRTAMGAAGQMWSRANFSTKTMLRETVNAFMQCP